MTDTATSRSTSSKRVGFVITGEFLTEHARDRMAEGRWDSALHFLTESIVGCTYEIAIAVLKGEKRFVGDSDGDLTLEEDDDAEHKAASARAYEGCYADPDGVCWRPYATVTSFGREDFYDPCRPAPGSDVIPATLMRAHLSMGSLSDGAWRVMHYADSDHDRVHVIHDAENGGQPVAVLFARTEKPPFWIDPARTPQDAWAEAKAAGAFIPTRGWQQTYAALHEAVPEAAGAMDPVWSDAYDPDAPEPAQPTRAAAPALPPAPAAGLPLPGGLGGMMDLMMAQMRTADRHAENDYAGLRAAIRTQAEAAGHIELAVPEAAREAAGGRDTLRIPRAPFENWALWRTDGAHLAAPWKVVSPQGLKMLNDDPFHSDWMLGAGLALEALDRGDPGREALREAVDDLVEAVQAEKMNASCAVLCGTGTAQGKALLTSSPT